MAGAGDSIIRNLALAVATLLADPNEPPLEVKRHADMVFARGCNTTITFLWRPFLANVTEAIAELPTTAQQPPAHVITGVALWDVLHVTNARRYAQEAATLADIMAELLEVSLCAGPRSEVVHLVAAATSAQKTMTRTSTALIAIAAYLPGADARCSVAEDACSVRGAAAARRSSATPGPYADTHTRSCCHHRCGTASPRV